MGLKQTKNKEMHPTVETSKDIKGLSRWITCFITSLPSL